MQKNRGAILEYIIRRENISINDLSLKLNVTRKTIYNWFDNEDLSYDIIAEISRCINFDLMAVFPELHAENSPRIYLVEDTDMDIDIFKILIKSFAIANNFKVFKNGEDAINKLLEVAINQPYNLPDCIFLDLNMPLFDGWEFLSQFHRLNINSYKKIKIYILSSSRSKADILRIAKCTLVTEFIAKPIELGKMKTIIRETI